MEAVRAGQELGVRLQGLEAYAARLHVFRRPPPARAHPSPLPPQVVRDGRLGLLFLTDAFSQVVHGNMATENFAQGGARLSMTAYVSSSSAAAEEEEDDDGGGGEEEEEEDDGEDEDEEEEAAAMKE